MERKKIYFWLQQLNYIGGTEQVTIDLCNKLVNFFDTTIISFSRIEGHIPYQIDTRIKISVCGAPLNIARFPMFAVDYLKHFKIFHFFKLCLDFAYYYALTKHKYRKYMENLVSNDGILITAYPGATIYIPRNCKNVFHYHFNYKIFNTFAMKNIYKISPVPDRCVFLTSETMDLVCKKMPKYKDRSIFIFNPIRFDIHENYKFNNNKLLFVGRYEDQKDPLIALEVCKILKERNITFSMDFYGEGYLQNKMEKFINSNGLDEIVKVHKKSEKIEHVYANTDILLMTSRYEGFPLVQGEAGAFGVATVSTNWGDGIHDCFSKEGYDLIIDSKAPIVIANKLEELLTDKDKLDYYKKIALNSSKRFVADNIVKRWVEFFDSIN